MANMLMSPRRNGNTHKWAYNQEPCGRKCCDPAHGKWKTNVKRAMRRVEKREWKKEL